MSEIIVFSRIILLEKFEPAVQFRIKPAFLSGTSKSPAINQQLKLSSYLFKIGSTKLHY